MPIPPHIRVSLPKEKRVFDLFFDHDRLTIVFGVGRARGGECKVEATENMKVAYTIDPARKTVRILLYTPEVFVDREAFNDEISRIAELLEKIANALHTHPDKTGTLKKIADSIREVRREIAV